VSLHYVVLVLCVATRFIENRQRNADLADVVQQAADAKSKQRVRREPVLPAEGHYQNADIYRMRESIFIVAF